ncbi:MAG: vWA domain-containing protein [bacterium]
MSSAAMSIRLLESAGPVLLVLAAALVAASILLYRIARARALLALRLASVLVVMVLLLDPVLSLVDNRSLPSRIAVLLDGSLSMSIPFPAKEGAAPDSTAPTRADRLRAAIRDTKLAKGLAQHGAVDVYRFGGDVEAASLEDPAALTPRDDRTDLARALARGVGMERRKTGAVVLMSDGAQNVGADPREAARRLGVPVFTIGVGGEGPVTDLSVVDVDASNVAYLDNKVPVKARLRARGGAVARVPVYLSEGDALLDSTRVDLPGGGGEREVDLEYRPTREGLHRYRVWTPKREGEISAENNTHLFVVRVLKEKIGLLLVCGKPSFELRFLKRALESDVSLDVQTVVLSLGTFPGRLGRGGPGFPTAWPDLAKKDVVVLLDCDSATLGAERANQVVRFVRERGGALLVMGAPAAFEPSGSPIEDLLPVPPTRSRPRTGTILASLTDVGRHHPVTQLDPEPVANAARWEELPPLGAVPVFGEPKPDAHVLVRGLVDGVPHDELVLVATRAEGRGRVLMIAGGPYWKWDLYLWGTGRSGDVLRRFLSRSVRWLVAREDFRPVMIRPSKNLFDGAEKVVVEGQVWDDDYRPVPGADVRANLRGPLGTTDEKSRDISLVELGGGRYRGELPGLPPGDYRIEGQAKHEGADLGTDQSEMTVAPYRMELEDPAPDFDLLRDVARESGGRFLPLEEVGKLPDLLDLKPVIDRTVREMPFLESPLLYFLLLVLLGAEWALRRRRGLP